MLYWKCSSKIGEKDDIYILVSLVTTIRRRIHYWRRTKNSRKKEARSNTVIWHGNRA